MNRKFLHHCFWILIAASLPFSHFSWAGGATVPTTRSTAALKKYMANFGSMMAGLEILRVKEKKPDWEAINLTLKEMSDTLAEMQKADAENAYKEYTDVLASGLVDLKKKASERNKGFFDSVDQLTDTCFKCHAAHRPGDYLVPKDKNISAEKASPK